MTGYTRTLLEEGRRGESGDAGAGFRGFSVVAYCGKSFHRARHRGTLKVVETNPNMATTEPNLLQLRLGEISFRGAGHRGCSNP